jgi:peptidoglycan/LPS O-acetylase OafA/YrhL
MLAREMRCQERPSLSSFEFDSLRNDLREPSHQSVPDTSPPDVSGRIGAGPPGVEVRDHRINTKAVPAKPRHRADIDGLRAVAVLPVILFHLNVPFFAGGFVGVDVFFVISGYLITTILLREMDRGAFSIVSFYERRSRRILPALGVMMMVVLTFCWFIFLSKDLQDLGQSLVAASLFGSNLLFYLKTGYFDAPALSKPLLHTWSLAVEEQFYIVFPILLWIIVRTARGRLVPILWFLTCASFAYSLWGAINRPALAFYLPFTRTWELLIGSLVAVHGTFRWLSPRLSQILAAGALASIVGSVLLLDSQSIFPGPGALPACLGTGLLMAVGEQEPRPMATRVLGFRPLVSVGLISYSLYLWHWPAIVIANYRLMRAPTLVETALLLLLIFVVATASWWFVERPVRERGILASRGRLFLVVGLTMGALVLVGGALHLAGGLPSRLPASVVELEQARTFEPNDRACGSLRSVKFGQLCEIGSQPPAYIIWGDSHARAIRPAAERLAATDPSKTGIVASANGCPPAMGLKRHDHYNACDAYNEEVIDLVRLKDIRTIFLVANWSTYLSPRDFTNGNLRDGLATTLAQLRGRDVYVVAPVPGGKHDVPSTLAKASLYGSEVTALLHTRESYLAQQERIFATFASLRERLPFTILYPHEFLCAETQCPVKRGDAVLYSDQHHLTPAGARLLTPMLAGSIGGRR